MISFTACSFTIRVGSGFIQATSYSEARIPTYTDARGVDFCKFSNVLFVPSLAANLISIEALFDKGYYYRTDLQVLFVKKDEQYIPVANIYRFNSLPYLVRSAYQLARTPPSAIADTATALVLRALKTLEGSITD